KCRVEDSQAPDRLVDEPPDELEGLWRKWRLPPVVLESSSFSVGGGGLKNGEKKRQNRAGTGERANQADVVCDQLVQQVVAHLARQPESEVVSRFVLAPDHEREGGPFLFGVACLGGGHTAVRSDRKKDEPILIELTARDQARELRRPVS